MPTIYINGEKHTPSSGTISKMEREGTMPAYSRTPPSSNQSMVSGGGGSRTQTKAPAKAPPKTATKAPVRTAAQPPMPRSRPSNAPTSMDVNAGMLKRYAPVKPVGPGGTPTGTYRPNTTVVRKNNSVNQNWHPAMKPVNQPFVTSKGPLPQSQPKDGGALKSALGNYAKNYTSTADKVKQKQGFAKGGKVAKMATGGKVQYITGSKTKQKYRVGQHFKSAGYEYEAMADGKFKRLNRIGATNPKNGDTLVRKATATDLRTLPKGKAAVSTQLSVTRPKKVTSKSKPPIPVSRRKPTGPGGTPTGRYSKPVGPGGTPTGRYSKSEQPNVNWGVPMSAYGGRNKLGPPKNPNDTWGIPQSVYKVKPKVKSKNPVSREARDEDKARQKRSEKQAVNFGVDPSVYKRKK
jgi:hypothetical protein